MYSIIRLLAVTLALGIYQQAVAQVTVGFTSSNLVGGLGVNSDTTAWSTTNGFTFELGVFASGFIPLASNEAGWAASWTVAANGTTNTGSTTWIDDGGSTYFQGSGAYLDNTAPFAAGSQLYIWGFDSKEIAGSSQWILLTNTSWLVQAVGSPATDFIDTTDSGTAAIVGEVTNGGVDLKSAAVTAIPEPATYAALFGAASLGLVFWRKRRKAA